MVLKKKQGKNLLVLVDGHAILHRAYHALPPLTNRSGELVNAVYGFCSILLKVVDDLKPQYLAIAFDTAKPTFRQMEYVGYQAQRPKTEVEFASQIEKVHRLVKALGVSIYEAPGFEADDVLGTLAKKASQKKLAVIIVSGDRDLFQLVNRQVRLYMPLRGLSEAKIFDSEGVEEKMGVKPEQIVDYKALVGDPSDNYPGVPGIGPKGAINLIERFGSLEKIYQSLGEIDNRILVDKLKSGKESALLSQRLATVVINVPLKFDLTKSRLPNFDRPEAIEVLKEFGFKSLIARISERREGKKKNQVQQKPKASVQESLF